ncbi:uncharacterized protein LOC126618083 [Malus sylvestris]|uniref:uncharacterized protein LOC126618083 n=1 Tax=Malus sylvestris TaxID=3752 RepID=UPI0021AC5B15|nr:uncharacterized protein LOC126618083 [Malus sylvestris]
MDNAKQILESVEHCPEDDDDDLVEPPPASKKRKMEKQVAKNGLKAKKAKALKKLVLQHEDLEEVETVVGPEQVANKDETVVAPKLLKGDADDDMIDIQQQEEGNDERTVLDVSEKGDDQTDDEEFEMTLSAWMIKTQIQYKLKNQDDDLADKMQADQEDGAQTDEIGWKPKEDVEDIILDPQQPEKTTRISLHLSLTKKEEPTTFFRENRYVFSWSPFDMLGIDPEIACHKLHVDPAAKQVIQTRRHFAPEQVVIIEAEIDKLLEARFIKEVAHSAWLANVVLVVKKEKGKLRVCVDYTNMNKTCPKDPYLLTMIDLLLASTSENQLLSFLAVYSGYNQIVMYKLDKKKITFMIERGTYCYKVMPFGLNNAKTIYQSEEACNSFRFPANHQPGYWGVHGETSEDGAIHREGTQANNAHTDELAGLSSALNHQLKRLIPMEYLDKLSIEAELAAEVSQQMSTLRYPEGNRQAEASNKTIIDCLKKSLTDKKGK